MIDLPRILSRSELTRPVSSFLDDRELGSSVTRLLEGWFRTALEQLCRRSGLPGLILRLGDLSSADVTHQADLRVRVFLDDQLAPRAGADVELGTNLSELGSRLPDSVTVGSLLQLDLPVSEHPAFAAATRDARLQATLATSPALADASVLARFIERYRSRTPPEAAFWSGLQEELGRPVADELRFTLQLTEIAGDDLPLVEALQRRRQAGAFASLRDLARFDEAAWVGMVTESTPAAAAQPARLTPQQSAQAIMRLLRARFPTVQVAMEAAAQPRIDRAAIQPLIDGDTEFDPRGSLPAAVSDAFPEGARASLEALRRELLAYPDFDLRAALAAPGEAIQNPIRAQVARFFANAPDFDFRGVRVDDYLEERGEAALAGIVDRAAVAAQLKRMKRVFQVTQDAGAIRGLMGEGLHSAAAIAELSEGAFVSRMKDSLGGAARARDIHARAQGIHSALNLLSTSVRQAGAEATPKALGAPLKNPPSWTELFGAFSLCECRECGSVLGPAAYLVDLLKFLDPTVLPPGGAKPIDVLRSRRPDLTKLHLTCENTNTLLPYVDLVNEILEGYIVNNASVAYDDGGASSGEPSVDPAHTDEAAYAPLATAVYPPSLPFDKSLETARVYLELLGVTRAQLMETASLPVPPDPGLLALDLSPAEASLIAGTDGRDLAEHYGFAPGTDLAGPLKIVAEFLARADIRYGDLLELLRTGFLNPDSSIRLVEDVSRPCDLGVTSIDNVEKLVPRAHRFIRLWRKSGWSIPELDRALRGLGAADLGPEQLALAGRFKRLRDRLNLPIDALLQFWAPLAGAPAPDLTIPALQATLQLGAADLALLLAQVPASQEPPPPLEDAVSFRAPIPDPRPPPGASLDPERVRKMSRAVHLPRALQLSLQDFFSLRALTGDDPFAGPSHTESFADQVARVRASGLSIAQLAYLYRDVDSRSEPQGPVAGEYDAFVRALKEAVTGAGEHGRTPEAAIEQALAERFQLDARTTSLLVEGLLHSRLVSTPRPLLDDFLALLGFGLQGEYFQSNDLTGPATVQVDVEIASPASRPLSLPAISVRWTGRMLATSDGTHRFTLSGTGGARLWISGELIIEQPQTGGPLEATGEAVLAANQLHDLKLEYFVDAGVRAQLEVSCENGATPRSAIPAGRLSAPPSSFASPLPAYLLLRKAAALARGLALSAPELAYLSEHGARFDHFSLDELPLDQVALQPSRFAPLPRLAGYVALRDRLPRQDARLIDLFGQAERGGDGADAAASVAAVTGWDAADVRTLMAALALSWADLVDERPLLRLEPPIALARRLNVPADRLLRWAQAGVEGPGAAKVVEEVRDAARARYDPEAWLAPGKASSDRLREQRRAAMIAYLLQRPEIRAAGVTSADRLTEYLLIDVEMSPGMMTSRVKQALSSVQLFVQRCLMNLESAVPPTAIDADRWAWMKRYQLWEANRRIFLYPENWLEPELRTGKSEIFRTMESELLQGALNDSAAENSFTQYLTRLSEVSRLQISGMCWRRPHDDKPVLVPDDFFVPHDPNPPLAVMDLQRELNAAGANPPLDVNGKFDPATEGAVFAFQAAQHLPFNFQLVDGPTWAALAAATDATDELHVFGRTFADARAYHHRTLIDGLSWTPWEKLPIDIEGNQLIPVVWNRRLHVFWPLISHKVAPILPGTTEKQYPKYVEIGFAWTEYIDGAWSAKQIISERVYVRDDPDFPRQNLSFKGVVNDYDLVLLTYLNGNLYAKARIAAGRGRNAVRYTELAWELRRLPPIPGTSLDELATTEPPGHVVLTGFEELEENNICQPLDFLGESFAPFSGDAGLGQLIEPRGEDEYGRFHLMKILGRTDTRFRMPHPHQHFQFVLQSPCFFEDDQRTYFMAPDRGPGIVGLDKSMGVAIYQHPLIDDFLRARHVFGVDGLLSPAVQSATDGGATFRTRYQPEAWLEADRPVENVDFRATGAYSLYNWELFFHGPLLIANRLSQEQRFAEAQRWYHRIFDPTSGTSLPAPARYWSFLPFRTNDPRQQQIEALLQALSADPGSPQGREAAAELRISLSDPFDPHAIAASRIAAYQKSVVMKYVDNLIAWGDQLFAQDTIESINEATQLYLLAAEILGPRPEPVPRRDAGPPKSYDDLLPLDQASTALEDEVPVEGLSAPPGSTWAGLDMGRSLHFGIPPNDKLLAYWDTVADRLFKVRHGQSLSGVSRQLALFEPRIDPAVLARARALGMDLDSVLSEQYAPLPSHRFPYALSQALSLCAEVRSLGGALLGALDRKDGEVMARLRAGHEKASLQLMRVTRMLALGEAGALKEALARARDTLQERRDHFQRLHGELMNDQERDQVAHHAAAREAQFDAGSAELIAQVNNLFPNITVKAGIPPSIDAEFGGINLGAAASAFARWKMIDSADQSSRASSAATSAGFQRRDQDWIFQIEQADLELKHLEQQEVAAELRIQVAQAELAVLERQLEHAEEMEAFLREKFTNQELYTWMVGRISTLYFQMYQMAYAAAKRAERCFRFERGVTDARFVEPGYWDSLRKGLLAGDALQLALKRMEVAYAEQNRREYEISKDISLVLLAPGALLALRQTGTCQLQVPEEWFDADYPGHYMRRLRTVAISVPCVTGPFTGLNCTLTLLSSKIRFDPSGAGSYPEVQQVGGDRRFLYDFAGIQAIATSHAQNDSGLFELSFRDDRYLPFEGAGVVSTWRIDMPLECNNFDFQTISDVVVRMLYTSRQAGTQLAQKAKAAAFDTSQPGRLYRMFNLKNEFSAAWYRFMNPPEAADIQELEIDLTDRFPFRYRSRRLAVSRVELALVFGRAPVGVSLEKEYQAAPNTPLKLTLSGGGGEATVQLADQAHLGGAPYASPAVSLPPGGWKIRVAAGDVATMSPQLRKLSSAGKARLNAETVSNLALICHYTVG